MSDTAAYAYDHAVARFALGEMRWTDGDMRVVLVNASYRPRQSEDRTLSDLRGALVTDPVRLIGRNVDDSSPGRVCLRASGVRFPAFSGEFQYAVIFDARGENLVAYSDLGPQRVTNGVAVVDYPEGEVCEFVIES